MHSLQGRTIRLVSRHHLEPGLVVGCLMNRHTDRKQEQERTERQVRLRHYEENKKYKSYIKK